PQYCRLVGIMGRGKMKVFSLQYNRRKFRICMRSLTVFVNWKKVIWTSMVVRVALMGVSLYGIYINMSDLLKPGNYYVPISDVEHLLYLYLVRFKIIEYELPDPKMRNLEYVIYALVVVYLFKIYDSVLTLGSVAEFGEHVIPPTFRPMGIL